MGQAYDFEQHRARAVSDFASVRDRYVRYSQTIESILRMALKNVRTHHISARAKDLDRFAAKASKSHPTEPTRPKYAEPLKEIEDLAAARIITYVMRALPEVEQAVYREFKVIQRSDKSEQLLQKAQVGYRSIHLIVEMKDERAALLEYQEFAQLRAEVQIRTILQHAWAEIEHDMRYKPSAEPNLVLSQRFTALAGLIEVGDREFEQIYDIAEKRRDDLVDLAQINEVNLTSGESLIQEGSDLLLDSAQTTTQDHGVGVTNELGPKYSISTGDYAEAIARYNALIQFQPRQFSHYLGRAKARFLSGDAPGAIADLAKSESLSPGNWLVAKVRSLLEGRGSDDAPLKTDYTLELREGHTALRDGDPERALKGYEEAATLGFSPVFSVFNRAMAHFLNRKYALCRATLNYIDPYPRSALHLNVVVLRSLCYLMLNGDDSKAAVQRIATSLEQSKAFMRFQYNGKSPLQDLEAGIRNHFTEEEQLKVAPVFEILRTFDSTDSKPAQPGLLSSLLQLAERAEEIGDPGEARRLFEEFLAVSETRGDEEGVLVAASGLGRLAKRQGDANSSVALFRRAAQAARSLGRTKDQSWNLGNMATIYRDEGEFQKAEDSYGEALHLAESVGDARGASITLDNLGVVRARLGDLAGAATFFQRAANNDPGPKNSGPVAAHRLNLGIVLWRVGKVDEARSVWRETYPSVDSLTVSKWRFKSPDELEEFLSASATDLPFF